MRTSLMKCKKKSTQKQLNQSDLRIILGTELNSNYRKEQKMSSNLRMKLIIQLT